MIKKIKAIFEEIWWKFFCGMWIILNKQKGSSNSGGNNDRESLLDYCLEVQNSTFYLFT